MPSPILNLYDTTNGDFYLNYLAYKMTYGNATAKLFLNFTQKTILDSFLYLAFYEQILIISSLVLGVGIFVLCLAKEKIIFGQSKTIQGFLKSFTKILEWIFIVLFFLVCLYYLGNLFALYAGYIFEKFLGLSILLFLIFLIFVSIFVYFYFTTEEAILSYATYAVVGIPIAFSFLIGQIALGIRMNGLIYIAFNQIIFSLLLYFGLTKVIKSYKKNKWLGFFSFVFFLFCLQSFLLSNQAYLTNGVIIFFLVISVLFNLKRKVKI